MRVVTAAPGDRLTGVVGSAWFLEDESPPPRERILPMASVEVVLNLAGPYRVLSPETTIGDVFSTGLRRATVLIENPVPLRHVAVQLPVHGGSRIGLRPTAGVAVVPGELGRMLTRLRERLRRDVAHDANPEQLLATTLAALEELVQPPTVSWRRVERTVDALSHEPELPISGRARLLGVSHKTLIADFATHVGMTPKRLAQLIRVQSLLSRLPTSGPVPEWTELVADSPYVDQSHFIRSFRQMVGLSPRAYRDLLASSGPRDPFFLGTPADG